MSFHSSSKKKRVETKHYPVIIVGAGAAGLFAGSILGRKALVLEKGAMAGRKLKLTGGGKCNYTHSSEPSGLLSHYKQDKRYIRDVIYALPPKRIIEYFKNLSIEPHIEENGKVFPKSMNAEDVVSALEARCTIEYVCEVFSVEKKDRFLIRTSKGIYTSDKLLIATGGIAYPHTGSDGKGYEIARSFGHNVISPTPALAPLKLDFPLSQAEGITLTLMAKIGKKTATDSAVITKKGISGPLAENISYLFPEKRDITLSFLDITKEEIRGLNGRSLLRNSLPLPDRLISALLGPIADKKNAELKKDEINIIIERLTCLRTQAIAIKEGAMSTHGGVDIMEVDTKTMESKLVSNLFFAGDVLDVDADCGGYSLTWAFASANAFASAIKL